LKTYLERIDSELEITKRQMISVGWKEGKMANFEQSFANLANNSLQITLQALENKDQAIKA